MLNPENGIEAGDEAEIGGFQSRGDWILRAESRTGSTTPIVFLFLAHARAHVLHFHAHLNTT